MSDEEFEVVDESTSPDEREIRVYDPKGDFLITVPAGAKITFGYFNPAGQRGDQRGHDAWGSPQNVARQTALRIYERGEKGNQLACFIGVAGFRDKNAIKMTRLTQRVTIETNFEDDGHGAQDFRHKAQRALEPFREEDEVSF